MLKSSKKKINKISKVYMDTYSTSVHKKEKPVPYGACMCENFEKLNISPYAACTKYNRPIKFNDSPYSKCIEETNFTIKYLD